MAADIKNPRSPGETAGRIGQKANHKNIFSITHPTKKGKGAMRHGRTFSQSLLGHTGQGAG